MQSTARPSKTTRYAVLAVATILAWASPLLAETCTTQSQMNPADRNAIASAAASLASKVQGTDAAGLRSLSVAELGKDFTAISGVVGATAPHLKAGTPAVEQVYLLDASTLKKNADGTPADAQFFCTLNKSAAETDLLIPALPPGIYSFALVDLRGAPAPWRLSFLLRRDQGQWLMAGIYPKPLTAAGHDGLWYWTQARQMVAARQPWNAWLYLQEADALLQPAAFVQSTHLEKLRAEETSTVPPPISEGLASTQPLVVKAKDGTEFRFTSLGVDDSLNTSSIDVAVHLKVDTLGDPAAARQRNLAAMSALLAAYPELRKPFHGIWVFSDAPNQPVYATEQAVTDIP